LTGGFSLITAACLRVITEVPLVQRLVPEERSAEEPTGGPGTGQLGIPEARSAAGTLRFSGGGSRPQERLVGNSSLVH